MSKIAFLFLVLDNPNFPRIWDSYFAGHEEKFNVYIHPKFPNRNTWRHENVIADIQHTEWGFIISAYLALLTAAYEDPKNVKFVFVSESCLPVKSFTSMYSRIMIDKNESFVKKMKVKRYDLENRITPKITEALKSGMLIKHYARMCLSRNHVKQLLFKYNSPLINLFKEMHVGDEFFLSTISPMKDCTSLAVVYDDWDSIEIEKTGIKSSIRTLYEKQEGDANIDCSFAITALRKHYDDISKNPKTIYKLSQTDKDNIKNTKSFFYRKFAKGSDIEMFIETLIR
jgi:hypothetical protein